MLHLINKIIQSCFTSGSFRSGPIVTPSPLTDAFDKGCSRTMLCVQNTVHPSLEPSEELTYQDSLALELIDLIWYRIDSIISFRR